MTNGLVVDFLPKSEVKAVSRLKSLSKIRKAQMSTSERQTAVVIRQMEIDIMMPD